MDEKEIDKLLDAFDYVRVIGQGGMNHIGIELTVSFGDNPKPYDVDNRLAVKLFLLTALNARELTRDVKVLSPEEMKEKFGHKPPRKVE